MQKLLAENGYPNVTIYYSGDRPRFNLGNWKTKHVSSNKYLSDYERQKLKDNQMAIDCDFGYMIMQGQTKGTMANINELLEQKEQRIEEIEKEDNPTVEEKKPNPKAPKITEDTLNLEKMEKKDLVAVARRLGLTANINYNKETLIKKIRETGVL
jgi:hypothetical protein